MLLIRHVVDQFAVLSRRALGVVSLTCLVEDLAKGLVCPINLLKELVRQCVRDLHLVLYSFGTVMVLRWRGAAAS